jgi:hypothetical protein
MEDTTTIVGLEAPVSKENALAERKERLLRQAEFYRVGIVHARAGIKQGARPEALFHTALDHATWAVRSRVDSLLRPTGINVATIMPFAVSLFGMIRRRRLVKPALGVLLAAAGVALYVQQRRAKAAYLAR